jgi:hypothetical protein
MCIKVKAYASIPYFFAEGIHVQNEHLKNGKTDVHAEHAHKELMQCSGCVSAADAYAQPEH